MEADIPAPNPAVAALLVSEQMRTLVVGRAQIVADLYRQSVAKDTGELAGAVRVETFIGGRNGDRVCARVVADAPHAAVHEATAHELSNALNMLAAL